MREQEFRTTAKEREESNNSDRSITEEYDKLKNALDATEDDNTLYELVSTAYNYGGLAAQSKIHHKEWNIKQFCKRYNIEIPKKYNK